ncbi:SRPBCC family protein [Pseudonocardia adelaidensis]|uniref:Activator of Hsp90 ATPase homologue 1/2-like C-terminal domain-containing protein n=1 Tax=Pseudonocardia adelaidensis TaxID=648754 RepID=A0ABP9P0G5_9PSEU
MDRGTFVDLDGRPAVRFERTYSHPPERVWSAITEPAELAHWFPATVSLEHRVGGTIEFTGDPNIDPGSGTVLEFDPPRRLAYTWGRDELHFRLEPTDDGGCTVTFFDVLEARDAAARNAAGWTVCLVELGKHVSGAVADGPHSATAEPWQPQYDDYVAAGMPAGAPIPGR